MDWILKYPENEIPRSSICSCNYTNSCLRITNNKRQEVKCNEAEKTAEGKCLGYQKSEYDDEPTERCKECKENIYFEE